MLKESGLNLPGVTVIKQVYDKGLESGLGTEDFCATYKIVKNNA